MSEQPIPRYTVEQMDGFPEGFEYIDGDDHVPVGTVLVKEADHLAAVAAAREQEQESFVDRLGKVYEQGQRDALAAVIDRVDEVYGDTDGRPSYAGVMDAIKGFSDVNVEEALKIVEGKQPT